MSTNIYSHANKMLSYIISYNFFHLVGLVGLEKLVWLDADSRDSRRVTSYSSPGSNGTLSILHDKTWKHINAEFKIYD